MRRNGQLLPVIPGLDAQGFVEGQAMGNLCGSILAFREVNHPSRLPLHLRYRFDQPGIYEVRYSPTSSSSFPDRQTIWTEWARFEIKPESTGQRADWLQEMSAHAPTDSTELLADFLPSILGIPDAASLQLLGQFLYHPDIKVRQYAAAGLTYWPDSEGNAAVTGWIRTKGPSVVMLSFLERRHQGPLPDSDSIVESALPYLLSDSPVLVSGAIEAVRQLTYGAGIKVAAELRARAFQATIDAAPHILALNDPDTRTRYREVLARIGNAVAVKD